MNDDADVEFDVDAMFWLVGCWDRVDVGVYVGVYELPYKVPNRRFSSSTDVAPLDGLFSDLNTVKQYEPIEIRHFFSAESRPWPVKKRTFPKNGFLDWTLNLRIGTVPFEYSKNPKTIQVSKLSLV